MKVIGIVSSPRKNGNVDTLVQETLKGAEESGHVTEKFDLSQMKFSDCQACMYCKTHDGCKLKDDLTRLMDSIKEADAVVFGSPVYYWQFNGSFRMFVDRLYMFLMVPDFKVTLPAGKKAVFITSQGNPDPKAFEPTFQQFDQLLKMYGFDIKGEIHMNNGNKPTAARERTDLMAEARSLGKGL